MKRLIVSAVEPYSFGDECASVTLCSGQAEIVVFSHPCDLKIGETVENRLSILDGKVRSAYLSDWSDEAKKALSVQKLERIDHYAYRGTGQVINEAEGLVEVLGFIIDFGSVPCDGAVEFEVARLDV